MHLKASLLGGLIQEGALDASHFSVGVAVGEVAQFVLRPDFPGNVEHLVFDANGTADGGETLVMITYF